MLTNIEGVNFVVLRYALSVRHPSDVFQRNVGSKMQLAAALVRSVFSALNLGPRAIVNTDLSDMTVSKCLQLAELSRQQRPQCFGEENRPSAGLNKNESYATRS